MKKLILADILKATSGQVLKEQETQFDGVGSDTRSHLRGQLFVALKGEAFDSHEFLSQALQQGAAGLLIQKKPSPEIFAAPVTLILVKDTLLALQQLAHFERKKSAALILAITGSNGKTTSKEFSAAVISAKKKVHFAKGSFNNHWGVPFTLLAEPQDCEVSLIEMGMNHQGELQRLCEIAEPDVVTCSMVGRAHIENFVDGLAGIAAAKEEIYRFAPPEAIRIYNLDNPFTRKMWENSRTEYPLAKKILTFSESEKSADVSMQIESLTMSEIRLKGTLAGISGAITVPVFGSQNLVNLMVAASNALAVGMTPSEIWQALSRCRTNWGRNQLVQLKSGAQMLFDGYNANPDSMRALLDNVPLLKTSGKKLGVFAQMLELGSDSAKYHQELGEWVGHTGLDMVWFYGSDSAAFEAGIRLTNFKNKVIISNSYEDSLASQVASVLNTQDIVLVKGSRGMKLERFVLACSPLNFSLNKE